MNPFMLLFTEVIYRPIFNILIGFLSIFSGNLWWAIIFLTLTIRFLLLKASAAGNDMQKHMTDIQPKLQEIQEKYKDKPEKLSEETMKLFKENGAWPLKGCMMTLVQLPVFIGLFFVVQHFAQNTIPTEWLYSFFYSFGLPYINLANIQTSFFWMDLLTGNNIILTVIASVLTYFQMKLTMMNNKTPQIPGANVPDMSKMMGFMNIFLVFMMGSFVYSMPTGVGLYILTTTAFSVAQFGWQYRELLIVKTKMLLKK